MLTVKEINNAKPRTKNYKLTDSKGLYLFITPSGAKYWRLDYSLRLKRKTIALGHYPALSLSEARKKQAEIKDLVAQGICPLEQRKQEKLHQKIAQLTFEDVAADWFKQWSYEKHPKTIKQTWTRLEDFVFPHLGKKSIKQLKLEDFIKCFKAMRAYGALEVAKRNMQKVKSIMKFAYLEGLITQNFISDITPKDFLPSRKKRHHARIEEKDLSKLLFDIHHYYGSEITVLALKLMALTFVRTSELIKARWDEIDFDRKLWIIPAERMKMRRKHTVPLATQTIQLLRKLQHLSGNTAYLFPDDLNRQQHISNNTLLYALYRMGYRSRMTGHGFRGLASTILHEQGYQHEHIDFQLAHAPQSDVDAAYNHAQYLKQRTVLMQIWADYIYHRAPTDF